MAKILSCREMGAECDFVARGKTVEEVLEKGMEHGRKVHGMTEKDFTPEQVAKARSLVREEAA